MATSTAQSEYQREWKRRNADKVAGYARRARQRNRPKCRICGQDIAYPAMGAKYCSEPCRYRAKRNAANSHRVRSQETLSAYKLDRGCDHCGYRACPAALQFHHRDPAHKRMRLTARQFTADTDLTRAEIAKCDLLCANCHFEEHHP